ncbi:MAG: hypothetical protein ACI9JN_000955 [Bacteroidia bacterium]|jgi:hypothetical protein
MNAFDIQLQTRRNISKVIDSLSLEQLNLIPEGLNNNILWNYGHIFVTQQALTYRLSGLPMRIGADTVELFKKGSAATHYSQEQLGAVKASFFTFIELTQKDYEAGKFQSFQTYPTSYGITLENIDAAIAFNNTHEALHLGYIMALRRIVTK